MKKRAIALVGVGKGGSALLQTLLGFPEIQIRFVVDKNPNAPGMAIAREKEIETLGEEFFERLPTLTELDLIFEATGNSCAFERILTLKPPNVELVGKAAAMIVFNLLEALIKERSDALARSYQELERKILEAEHLNRKLQRINDERSKYLARSAHQLKAPFAAIQSYVELMLEGYVGEFEPKAQAILQKIRERCETLTSSIRDMLELAKLALECSSVLAERRGIVLNILDNAINYSCPKSQVKVEVQLTDPAEVCISVIDQGIGIPASNLDKIFDEYFRSNNAAQKHQNGSGLGLSIAKEIAQLNNLRISVESELGNGSTFRVFCPVVHKG